MTDTTTTTDEATIRDLHDGFVQANRTADWAFLEAHMYPDNETLTWFNLNQSNYFGREHIIQLWKMLLSMMPPGSEAHCITSDERFRMMGDTALVTYLLEFAADLGALGKIAQDTRSTEVWQRIDGEWKMVHFHCSNYVPGVMGGK
jgi:ketosteroid isomerase-like protein